MAAEISAAIFIGYKELCVNPPVSMAVVSRLEMTHCLIFIASAMNVCLKARDSQANC